MLNEWSDRDPEPPSPWRDRLFMGVCFLTSALVLRSLAQALGLL